MPGREGSSFLDRLTEAVGAVRRAENALRDAHAVAAAAVALRGAAAKVTWTDRYDGACVLTVEVRSVGSHTGKLAPHMQSALVAAVPQLLFAAIAPTAEAVTHAVTARQDARRAVEALIGEQPWDAAAEEGEDEEAVANAEA